MNFLFTIAIPAYKGKYLRECIQSCLQQSYSNFELIIVNDASPENLTEIVTCFNDPRIKYYINEKNAGAENVVDNWNKCLSLSGGEYFVLMGDDDKMEKDYLQEFSNLIQKYPDLDIYHCRSYLINSESEKISLTPVWSEYENIYDNILHRMKYGRMQYISDFLYRTSTLLQNNGFYKLPLAWGSDDISSFVAMKEKGIAHTNKPVFCYRQSPITISNSGSAELKLIACDQYKEWLLKFTTYIPSNKNEILLHKNIKEYMPTFFRINRVYIISMSLQKGMLRNLLFWCANRRKFSISNGELVSAILNSIKQYLRQN